MALTPSERERLRRTVANIYSEGYTEGMTQAAEEYDLGRHIPNAGARMEKPLKQRLTLVDAAVDSYIKLVEKKQKALAASSLTPDQQWAELSAYAQRLADSKSEIIAEMEFAEARLDGAGNLMDESGVEYEWRFPHFELGRPGHEECPICAAIRDDGPYTQEEAEAQGMPSFPHLNCDHSWVLTPKGEITRTEEFPPLPHVSRGT